MKISPTPGGVHEAVIDRPWMQPTNAGARSTLEDEFVVSPTKKRWRAG